MTNTYFKRLLTEYCIAKATGRPYSVKQFFLYHTIDSLEQHAIALEKVEDIKN